MVQQKNIKLEYAVFGVYTDFTSFTSAKIYHDVANAVHNRYNLCRKTYNLRVAIRKPRRQQSVNPSDNQLDIFGRQLNNSFKSSCGIACYSRSNKLFCNFAGENFC